MKTSDLLRMCVQNLRRRKFRTFLTVIGVVIGTAAIISMISLGIGINQSIDDMVSQWGDLSVIDVYGGGADTKLDDDTLASISMMEGVSAVTPFAYPEFQMQIVSGKKNRFLNEYPSAVGVYPSALEKLDYTLSDGEVKESDGKAKSIPVIFGSDVAYEFSDTRRGQRDNTVSPYPDEFGVVQDPFVDPMKDDFTLRIVYYENNNEKFLEYDLDITGVMSAGDLEYSDTRFRVFMDVKDIARLQKDYEKATEARTRTQTEYTQVRVKVSDLNLVSSVQQQINDMNFFTHSLEEQRQEMMGQTQQIQVILGGLGAVSLLVAAISIANTMVMSVYERTREIGIMKVLGCFVKDIRSIFLVEAALIGFFGGLIGVALSYIISFIINNFGGSIGSGMGMMGMYMNGEAAKLSIIPFWLVAVGMLFATFVGIAAGFYPAKRAVKISALEAIKQD